MVATHNQKIKMKRKRELKL